MAVLAFANPTNYSDFVPMMPTGCKAITPSDTDTFERPVHVYVGATAGNINCVPANGGAAVVVPVAAHSILPFQVTKVSSTNTTATTLWAIY